MFGKVDYELKPIEQAHVWQGVLEANTQWAFPIMSSYKNKLRDLIYYFMENIIPGLPTESKPVCYVEWRPIRWLSNSNL